MVVIRLSRGGARNRPFYHLTVADRRAPRDGRYIERIGFFNPIARRQEERLRVDLSRFDYWVSKGAKPSDRVTRLVRQAREGQPVEIETPPVDGAGQQQGLESSA